MNKALTMTELVLGIILIIGIFSGSYLWFAKNMEQASVSVDSKYTDVYNNISAQQSKLYNDTSKIEYAAKNITEAPSIYSVAVNGFKGFAAVISLFFGFTNTAIETFYTLIGVVEIPAFVKILTVTAIVLIIVFLIISVFKGEQKM